MKKLLGLLAEYLSRELSNAVDTDLSTSLRVFFSGPPRQLLADLFEVLTRDGGCLKVETSHGAIEIPVYLLDPRATDPVDVPRAARCTDSYFVGAIRNNSRIPVCLALHECVSSTLSVDSTVTRLGIPHELPNIEQWMQSSLVRGLLRRCLTEIVGPGGVQDALPLVQHALEEAWDLDERHRDKRTAWRVIERLCDVRVTGAEPHHALASVLGLPRCDVSELGSKDHLATLARVADFFQSCGLRSGFQELEQVAGDDLVSHVRALRGHIEEQGLIEASEFASSPLQVYCPFNTSPESIPDWWRALSVDAWSRLLDAGSDTETTGKLDVTPVNLIAAVPRGMPTLVRDAVELEITISDSQEPIEVAISRGSGNAALQEISHVTVDPGSPIEFTDSAIPEHERFVRYKLEADGYSPVTIKFIILDKYGPGVVAICRGAAKATPFKLNRKAKNEKNKTIERYECDLQLPGMGSHQLDLFTASSTVLATVIRGYEVDAEHTDPIERPINRVDNNHAVCLIETDEECHYDFSADRDGSGEELPFRIYVTADEVEPSGASSEFDRLVIAHRAVARREHSNARVEPVSCRTANLEEWALEDEESFRPLIIGPDYLDHWRKPRWAEHPTLSGMPMLVDPRPTADEFEVPKAFREARRRVLQCLDTPPDEPTPTAGTLRLFENMRDDAFSVALGDLLGAYLEWLGTNYDHAAWTDVIAVHGLQAGAEALDSTPYAILLTPFHPIRLAWQCRAQEVLQQALDKHARCPAASMLNPGCFPDCIVLPCRSATGSIEQRPFAAMTTTSDYWSVLWSIDAIGRLGDTGRRGDVFGSELGIGVDGLASGFSAQQVARSLDEVSRLMSAKSTLRVGISSDGAGAGSCNEGLDSWCRANLGPDEDYWSDAGPRSIIVADRRDAALQPEQAVLASLTSRTDAAVRWFTGASVQGDGRHDLSIIAHLGTMNHQFARQGIRSAIDSSALTRWRVRKQLPSQNAAFIAESRIGEIPSSVDAESLAGKLLECVDAIERRCRDSMDSYVFAPNMAVLRGVVGQSWYTAVSSSSVDAACFFGPTERAYLWDYELPAYSRRAGENCGYFLLAKESPGMLLAVRSALRLLSNGESLEDAAISALLKEISRRGMPTLKRLTTGGSMSLGELGMLVGLRFFQSEFEEDRSRPSLLPVADSGETLNLVVPADPFKNHFEDLRVALENRQGERPDLLVVSIGFVSGSPNRMRITPVEIKARGGSMSSKERRAALSQASLFGGFLARVQEQTAGSELWSIAWRSLIATLLDYGFRVYGQLEHFMQHDEWARQHSAVLRALSNDDLAINIDTRGRLIVIDNTNTSIPQDLDGDEFHETLVMSHKDAYALLTTGCESFMEGVNARLGDWQLKPDVGVPPGDIGDDNGKGQGSPRGDSDGENGSSDFDAAVDTPVVPSPTAEPTDAAGTAGDHTDDSVIPDADVARGVRFAVGATVREFTQEEVFFAPGNTALNQLNVGVVGDLGTGKTQLVQALIHQLRADPGMNRGTRPNVLIFDYKKDYTKPAFVEATGARIVDPFDIPLNLFDTRDSQHRRNAWLERAKFFSDVLDKIYSGIGPAQRQRIKTAVREAYDACGSFGADAPTINDVFDAYKRARGDAIDSPYSIMSDLVDGGYFVSDSSAVVPFSEFLNGIVVLDLAEVGQDDRTKNMLVVIFLNLFYEHMLRIEKRGFVGENPRLRFINTMLLVDEADNIMKYEFDVLRKILLQGREFGVGVLLASQYLSHFKTAHENYLEPLLTWFVHKVPSIGIKDLEGIGLTGVGSDLVDAIKSLECHECLFKTLGVDGRLIRATPFFELLTRETQ